MKKLLLKLIRSPFTIIKLLSNKLFIPFYFRLFENIVIGHGCVFQGMPDLRCDENASIHIGNHVTINSAKSSNIAGISHPTYIVAKFPKTKIKIGSRSGISGASIVAYNRIEIGENVLIGAGACIWDNDFHPLDSGLRHNPDNSAIVTKPVFIEDNVFIGAHSIILKGVRIGKNAIIGAGSVVTRSVSSDDVVAGNPARSIKKK